MEGLFCQKADHGISDLNLTTGSRCLGGKFAKDPGLKNIAPGNDEIRWRILAPRLFDHFLNCKSIALPVLGANHTITVHLFRAHLFDGHHIAAAPFVVGFNHLAHAAGLGVHDHVWQQYGKGFISHQVARAPDGMAEAEGFLLAGETCLASRRQVLFENVEFG